MVYLLKIHKISIPKNKLPKIKDRAQRIKKLIEYIIWTIQLTEHAKEKISQRRLRWNFNWETTKRKIAWLWSSTVLDTTTNNIRVCYKGRWIIDKKWNVITYMHSKSQTLQTVIANHKKIHKYKPMEFDEIERYWYT